MPKKQIQETDTCISLKLPPNLQCSNCENLKENDEEELLSSTSCLHAAYDMFKNKTHQDDCTRELYHDIHHYLVQNRNFKKLPAYVNLHRSKISWEEKKSSRPKRKSSENQQRHRNDEMSSRFNSHLKRNVIHTPLSSKKMNRQSSKTDTKIHSPQPIQSSIKKMIASGKKIGDSIMKRWNLRKKEDNNDSILASRWKDESNDDEGSDMSNDNDDNEGSDKSNDNEGSDESNDNEGSDKSATTFINKTDKFNSPAFPDYGYGRQEVLVGQKDSPLEGNEATNISEILPKALFATSEGDSENEGNSSESFDGNANINNEGNATTEDQNCTNYKYLARFNIPLDTEEGRNGGMLIRDKILYELIHLSIETRGKESIVGLSRKLENILDETEEDNESSDEVHYKNLTKYQIPLEKQYGEDGKTIIWSEIMFELVALLLNKGGKEQIKIFLSFLVSKMFENEEDHKKPIEHLFGILVNNYLSSNKPFTFKYDGNFREGGMVNIPRCQSKRYFTQAAENTGWIEDILSQVVSNPNPRKKKRNSIENSNNDDGPVVTISNAAEWLCVYLAENHEETFHEVAKQNGLVGRRKMSKEEAAAMWSEANVPMSVARIILRHLRAAFGFSIQVPERQLNSFTEDIIEIAQPQFGSFLYYKNEQKKSNSDPKRQKPEKIHWTMCDCTILIKEDIKRIILNKVAGLKEKNNIGGNKQFSIPKFTYGDPFVDVIMGSDHGAGSSRFIVKINLKSSQSQREKGRIEYGSRVINFGNIRCKKDDAEILLKVTPNLNDMIKKLKHGKIVGVTNEYGEVDVVFVPKLALNMSIVKIKSLCCQQNF